MHQQPPEDQDPRHVLVLLVFIIVTVGWVIGLYFGNTLLSAMCSVAQVIVGLIAIEPFWKRLSAGWAKLCHWWGVVVTSVGKYLKIVFNFLQKTKKPVFVGTVILPVVGLCTGLLIWFMCQRDPFDPIQVTNNEYIGISVGRTIFDTDQVDSSFKTEAAQAYQSQDYNRARAYWELAIREDETDAEAAIYKEDQLVLDSNRPYITIVVLVSLSGGDHAAILTGRDILQGAYVAQAEYNGDLSTRTSLPSHDNSNRRLPNGSLLRLIIANVGTPSSTDTQVAQRIVQVWDADKTIIGVTGQFTSENTIVQELNAAKIPMLSSTQLTGTLVGIPYLLSVAPSPEQEGSVAADYACSITHDRIAIFYGSADLSSNQLEQAFSYEFASCGDSVESFWYTLEDKRTLEQRFNEAWSANHNLKLIYLPDVSPDDAIALLFFVRSKGSQAQVLGSNAFYQFVHATEPGKSFAGLLYTAFAFHDEWSGNLPQKPWLLKDYPAIFNAQKQHQHSLYGTQIPNADVILSYDATDMLVGASREFLENEQSNITHHFDALWKKLKAGGFQGVSGCLAFDSDGQPLNKAVAVLQVQTDGTNHMVDQQGRYKC
jgi:ABC-type branched-subunit amino acid transport system substrate-binding protein